MRENIGLYHGKRENDSKWIEGYLYPSTGVNKGKWLITVVDNTLSTSHTYSVIPETIGEFTGLFDSKGNGIFEGHIIEYFGERGVVMWDRWEATFLILFGNEEHCYFDDIDTNISTIIGNLYDNPELLNKED